MSRRYSCLGCITRLLTVLILAGAGAAALVYYSLKRPYQGFEKPVILDFPKGTTTRGMADQLAQAGVIRYAWEFLAVRSLRPRARLLAGEYQFAQPASASTVFDRIARGDVFFYELTVPEGSDMFDIAASLQRLEFLSSGDFLSAARNPGLIRDLAPGAPTLEGYLFPSTYRLARTTTVVQLCRMMTEQFRKNWRELGAANPSGNVNAIVTLASMIEKETALPAERPLVASVYTNRLRIGMALDCDPTTIYAARLEERFHNTIYRSDLASDNAYNTYRHAGLPPGPIANPGLAALKAALAPADTKFLYFVAKADGSGGHQFSETKEQHDVAVQQYRRATRQTAPAPATTRPRHHRRRA